MGVHQATGRRTERGAVRHDLEVIAVRSSPVLELVLGVDDRIRCSVDGDDHVSSDSDGPLIIEVAVELVVDPTSEASERLSQRYGHELLEDLVHRDHERRHVQTARAGL
nr:hypothetical protein [Glycomyces sp. YM15]